MCVIMTVENERERPTQAELEAAADANPHGAGIAWVEKGAVKFRKVGPVDIEQVIALALKVPTPFVVHFRITSSGETTAQLSHPFPLRLTEPLALAGRADAVLFHNGTWRDYKRYVLSAVASTGRSLGDGPMSDTRGIAYLATVGGRAVLATIPDENKLAVLSKDGKVTRHGNGWSEYAPGMWVSNTYWVPRPEPKVELSKKAAKAPAAKATVVKKAMAKTFGKSWPRLDPDRPTFTGSELAVGGPGYLVASGKKEGVQ